MSTTADDCKKRANELRTALPSANLEIIMLLERAAREIDHLNDLVKSYRDMARR